MVANRYVLAAALLALSSAGCEGRTGGIAPPTASGLTPAASHVTTFRYTGVPQLFRVPASVKKVTVIAVGAPGGELKANTGAGLGGRVWAIIPVTPGEKLAVFVGGQPAGVEGGYNGGGSGGMSRRGTNDGYGGGGASDIRESGDRLSDRVIVAGGGGGQGNGSAGYYYGDGGKGGGDVGDAGSRGGGVSGEGGGGGAGGSQNAGGAGGSAGDRPSERNGRPGDNGLFGRGGAGGAGCNKGYFCRAYGAGGGGGGGGYYGAGGGGGAAGPVSGGGGGGGSSYITPTAFAFHNWKGWRLKQPNGLVVISW